MADGGDVPPEGGPPAGQPQPVTESPPQPRMHWLPDWLRPGGSRRPWLIGEIVIVFVLVKVYDYVRSFAELQRGPAMHHAQQILDLEQTVRIDVEHVVNMWVVAHGAVNDVASYWYELTHVGGTLAVLAFCYILGPGSTVVHATR